LPLSLSQLPLSLSQLPLSLFLNCRSLFLNCRSLSFSTAALSFSTAALFLSQLPLSLEFSLSLSLTWLILKRARELRVGAQEFPLVQQKNGVPICNFAPVAQGKWSTYVYVCRPLVTHDIPLSGSATFACFTSTKFLASPVQKYTY
jgi:hypothetical protein